ESASSRPMMSPVAASKPAAVARSTPRTGSWTTRAPAARATSAVSSSEPLSTTMTSSGARVCAARASRQCFSMCASFSEGITTLTVLIAESLGGRRARPRHHRASVSATGVEQVPAAVVEHLDGDPPLAQRGDGARLLVKGPAQGVHVGDHHDIAFVQRAEQAHETLLPGLHRLRSGMPEPFDGHAETRQILALLDDRRHPGARDDHAHQPCAVGTGLPPVAVAL